jgi:alcohol dehydrogenase class IV
MALLAQIPPIRVPVIYYGRESLDRIKDFTQNRIFVVTDKIAKKLVEPKLLNLLQGKEVMFFDETEPDPKDTVMTKAGDAARTFKPELIMGIGGGSVMDTAKGTYFLYGQPSLTLADLNISGKYNLQARSTLVLVPTTSGTGSESSAGLVYTETSSGKKTDVLSFELGPRVVILDPTLPSTMPSKLTIASGLDALAQAIENGSRPTLNDILFALDLYGIKVLFKYLPLAAAQGASDLEIREKIHYAASMIGIAMGNAGLGVGHACGHAIGGVYHIAHGLTVAQMLPYTIEYNKPQSQARYAEMLEALNITGVADPTATLSAMVKELLAKFEVPSTIKGFGISPTDWEKNLDKVVAFAAKDACLYTNARPVKPDEIKRILQYAYEGKTIDF